jgi:hypothetical protein
VARSPQALEVELPKMKSLTVESLGARNRRYTIAGDKRCFSCFLICVRVVGKSMKYRCQSCNYELPDIWEWKIVDRSKYLMVVTCPHCNNEFIRMEYDPDTPYGYKVIPSMIFVPQGIKRRNRIVG